MSVSKMKKLVVLSHKDDADVIVKRLVRLRCVDISSAELDSDRTVQMSRYNCDSKRAELEARLVSIGEAMTALNKYTKQTRSLFSPKARVNIDKFVADGRAEKVSLTVAQTLEAIERRAQIKNECIRLKGLLQAAVPYINYDMPLGAAGTESTDVILGALPATAVLDTVGKALYKAGAAAEKLLADAAGIYISVICHKKDTEGVLGVLADNGFNRAVFKGVELCAAEYVEKLNNDISSLEKEDGELEARLTELAEGLEELEIYYDIEQTNLTAVINQQKMIACGSVVELDGWIPEACVRGVETLLSKFDCAYEIEDPQAYDNPPILLKNNGFASNFEWVLGMYSYPVYGRFDPTFIMSIFYFIIFGIMFADAGYGLILTLACFIGVKILKPSESMERFLKMFGYCGISCIFFGVLFGAYFGDLPLAIMRNMMGMAEADLPNLALLGSSAANVAVWFDPLQNPMAFLIFSLAVGAVHLIAGMAVKFVILCKDGQILDAIFDIGAYWLLFAGIGLIFVIQPIGIWVTVAAAALIVLTHGRGEKNIVMKFLKGLLGLYDLIAYVSDLLSYSRILALGLAAGVIAQVVNILGTMGGPTVVGFIALVVAFVVGHLLNIAINVLGTFVHTSRLQYIEFFGKFYEDGGVVFEPALPSEKYVIDESDMSENEISENSENTEEKPKKQRKKQ